MNEFVALILSLVLLFSCVSSAEALNANLCLNCSGQQLFAGAVQMGCDNDGCFVISVADATYMGIPVSFLLQINDEGLTVASGAEAYTVTLTGHYDNGQYSGNADAERYTDVTESGNAEAQTLFQVLMNEVNRIAGIAARLGIVDITAEGGLIFSADIDSVIGLCAGYLAQPAVNETVIPALAAGRLWKKCGLPDAASVQAYIAMLAETLGTADWSAMGISGRLYVKFSADGSAAYRFNYNSRSKAVSVTGGYSGSTFNMSADITADGEMVSSGCVIAPYCGSIRYANSAAVFSCAYRISDDGIPGASCRFESVRTDAAMDADITVVDAVFSHTEGKALSAYEIVKLAGFISRLPDFRPAQDTGSPVLAAQTGAARAHRVFTIKNLKKWGLGTLSALIPFPFRLLFRSFLHN